MSSAASAPPIAATALQAPSFAVIDTAAAGDQTIVPAVAAKTIRLLSVVLICSGAQTVRWKSGAPNILSGAMAFAANGGYSAQADRGLLATNVGDPLVLNLLAAVQVSGHISYVAV